MTPALRLLLAGCCVAVLATACSSDDGLRRDEAGAIVIPGSESVFEIREGDCLDPGADLGETVGDIEAVPCTSPHTHEVYAKLEYDEDPDTEGDQNDVYPGAVELQRYADLECLKAFEPYVGVDYFESGLFFTYLFPTLDGWNDKDDKEIVCVVGTTGERIEVSVEGSGGEFPPPELPTPAPAPGDDGDGEEPTTS